MKKSLFLLLPVGMVLIMRRVLWASALLIGVAIFTSSGLFAHKAETEGKAWLDAKTEPAEVNVDGTWDSSEWGMMLLHQAKNAREVTGTSDNWEIEGVVSGKKVFHVFSSKGRLVYTAEASQKEDGSLSGSYIKGIMQSDSGNKAMLLRKTAEAQTSQPA